MAFRPTKPIIQWGHRLNRGLVGAWLFTENGGSVVDDHSYSQTNLGTLTGTPAWAAGYDGPAMSFDGSTQYLTCAAAPLPSRYLDRYTIAAVIKVSSFTDFRCIMCRGSGGNRNYEFDVEQTTGKLRTFFTTSTNVFKGFTATTALSLNTWYWVAATFNGSVQTIYINGKNDGTNSAAFTPENPSGIGTGIMSIGSIQAANKFAGLISEVRLWDRGLTHDEIIQWTNTDYSEFRPSAGLVSMSGFAPPVLSALLQTSVSM